MSKQSRKALLVGIAVGLIGIAVGIASWLRPIEQVDSQPQDSAKLFTEQQGQEAKARVCEAHSLIDRATRSAASRTSDDPNVRGLLSLNVRLGATVSAAYLRATVDQNPAAPQDLLDAVEELALTFNNGTLLQISEASQAELDEVFARLDQADAKVTRACQ